MDVFGLGLKIREEGAATVEASLKRLGAELAKTALTVGGLSAAFSKLVSETSQAQFAEAQLQAVLKSTGSIAGQTAEGLQTQASALQNVTMFGDDAIVKMQSLLLTFTQVRGEVYTQAVPAILDLATAMGTDLQSAAIQVGKALNDPIAGLSSLSRSGIQFTEAQKETIKSLVETGETAKAQGIILAELQRQFGGAANAARNTLGGALAGLANAFGDLFEVSKEGTAGVVGIINKLTDALTKLKDNMDVVKQVAITLAGILLGMFSPKLVALLTAYAARMIAAQTAHLAAAAAAGIHNGALVTLIATAGTLSTAFGALWTAIGGPLGVAIAGIVGFGAFVIKQLDETQAIYDEMDRSGQANMERQIAAIKARKQAEEDEANARKARQKQAIEDERKRIATLIEYNSLLPLRKRDLAALATAELQLDTELQRSNTSMERKAELMRQLAELRPLLYEVDTAEKKLSQTFTILGRTFAFAPTTFDKDSLARRIKEMAATLGTEIKPSEPLEIFNVFDPEKSRERMRLGFKAYGEAVAEEAQRLKVSTGEVLLKDIGTSIAGSFEDGIVAGLQAAIQSGKISDMWKAMSQVMVSQISNMMVNVALTYIGFAKMIANIQAFLVANPIAAIAAATAMLLFAQANGGKSSMGKNVMAGGAGGLQTAIGAPGTPMQSPIVFGSTSASTAVGMQPRQAMNFTIIGPNDPSAQRAIQELMRKAESRGRIG